MLLGCQAPSALPGFCVKSKVLTKHDFEVGLLLLGAYAMDEILIVL